MIRYEDLYDWQKQAYQSWIEADKNSIIEGGTGIGKSIFALYCIQEERKPTIIIVPTKALMYQWKEEVIKNLGVSEDKIGLIGDGHREYKPITIAIINSIRQEDLTKYSLLTLDECHKYPSVENIKPIERSNNQYRLGITATLQREDNRHKLLEEYIGRVSYRYTQADAVKDGILNTYEIINVGVNLSLEEQHAYDELDIKVKRGMQLFNNDFVVLQRQLKNYMHPNFRVASETIKSIGDRRQLYSNSRTKIKKVLEIVEEHKNDKIIIFNEYIGMAEAIYDRLLEEKYLVGIYHSTSKEKKVIDDFAEGKISILVTVKSLNEGLNVPSVNVGIVVSGNNVRRNTIQRMGRILRKQEGKKAVFYQLYCKNTKEYQDVRKRSELFRGIADSIIFK